jgi:acetoin utilization deacetylase AcuC-like enzyme
LHIAYISHPDCLKHEMGSHHPECPARLRSIEDQLIASHLMHYLTHVDAPLVTREQLERVHPAHYIDAIQAASPETGLEYLDPDTAMNPFTWNAALRSAGAVVKGVDMVMSGEVEGAFCAGRPPGHHAERARAMGFCFFNNVAVGAMHALVHHGLERVAIVDFDVHHGNGTEEIFHDDPRVMLCSTFQHPFYPGCGANSGNDHIINVPLPAYTDGEQYREAFSHFILPALERFAPQMVFFSAGFDAHRDDDMAMLKLTEPDYAWITREVRQVAGRYASGRIVSVLEGGYELHALARSVMTHIKVLGDY